MTVQQSLGRLEASYITWMEKHNKYRDAGYIWWERINDCKIGVLRRVPMYL